MALGIHYERHNARLGHLSNQGVVDPLQVAREKGKSLAPLEDAKPSRKLIKRFTDEVDREMPAPNLWMPSTLSE